MTDYFQEDYISYRISKAKETLEEVEKIIELGYWNTAINRMYYASFYAIGALLAKQKVEVSSHSGLRQKFGEHFVKTGIIDAQLGKHFTELFDKRNKGDYNDFFDFDEKTVLKLFPKTKELIDHIERLLSK